MKSGDCYSLNYDENLENLVERLQELEKSMETAEISAVVGNENFTLPIASQDYVY